MEKEMNRNEMAENGDERMNTSYIFSCHILRCRIIFWAKFVPLLLLLLLLFGAILLRFYAGNFSEPTSCHQRG